MYQKLIFFIIIKRKGENLIHCGTLYVEKQKFDEEV